VKFIEIKEKKKESKKKERKERNKEIASSTIELRNSNGFEACFDFFSV
jgi:hypothetical protein